MLNMSLDDEYIPNYTKDTELKLLRKLSEKVQGELIIDWYERFGLSNKRLRHITLETLQQDFKFDARSRRTLSTVILTRYWPHGLNLYQLSDIDFNMLIAHPLRFKWNSMTMYKSTTEKIRPHYNIPQIISELSNQLSNYYLSYITSRHSSGQNVEYIRLQFFERSATHHHDRQHKLLSRSPYYIALLDDQELPFIIHTAGEDPTSKLIMETFKKILSDSSPYTIKFRRNEPPKESIKSIGKVLQSCSTSRNDNALGRWSQYGDGKFEVSPLNNIDAHGSMKGKKIRIDDNEAKSMLKFKGSTEYPNGCESQTAVSKVAFQLKDPNDDITIGFKFHGSDVFGGIHQLCNQELIDVDKVPGWLSGENGASSGTIKNGDFIKKTRK